MTGRRMGTALRSSVVALLMGIGLSGCDYWPPALQAQIEQLQIEAQNAAAERVKLMEQLNEANKIKDELQLRINDLTRTNSELSARVSTLEQALVAEREKVAKLSKAALKPIPAKVTAKPVAKSTKKGASNAKNTAKKKTTTKQRP